MQRRRGGRWTASIIVGLAALSGCTVERIGPAGVTMTRPIRVRAQDVRVFKDASMVTDTFSIIDQVYVRDDAETQPRVLEERLRGLAGARGANAIILDPMNRPENGVRVDLRPTLDKPFEYFQGTAIWIGDGPPPHRYLGTLGGDAR
jgi:hypothetical protein